MKKLTVMFALVLTVIAGCDRAPQVDVNEANDAEISYGVIKDGVYTNDYFELTIKVPENWSVQSEAVLDEMISAGTDAVAGDDENLQAALKASQKRTVNLFSFFKHELGTPVEFNPSVIAVAEHLVLMPGIKRGSDYNFHAKKLLEASQLEYTFNEEEFSKEFSGISFDVMPTQMAVGAITVNQEYYATRIKDYVLAFVLSYTTDEEAKELRAVLDTLEFSE